MKLLVATDAHIYETPDGKHWTPAIYGYDFWKRYLNIFECVRIVARTKKIKEKPEKVLLVDGPGVEIFPIPFYQGPKQLFINYIKIQISLKKVAEGCDVALFRMPSQTAEMTYKYVKGKMPIGGEIVYDPTDDLKRKDTTIIIKILNKIISSRLKKFCREANGLSYVTKESIQRNYPSTSRLNGESRKFFETYYSTITLSDDFFTGPREYNNKRRLKVCLSDVSMNSERKGEAVLIKAIKLARDNGYDVSATLIGDGSMKKDFEKLSNELGIGEYITFTGRLESSEEVKNKMLDSDMFVFPTQAEGLPRGIIEAMAIGLPVLSTPVGGIPEIIEEKYLFNPYDIEAFSKMICHLIDNPSELNDMSYRNFKKSLEFSNKRLQKKRDEFYSKLANLKENVE